MHEQASLGGTENLDMTSFLAVMTYGSLQPSIISGLLLWCLGLPLSVSTLGSIGFLSLQGIGNSSANLKGHLS